jgi:hypothetical protein
MSNDSERFSAEGNFAGYKPIKLDGKIRIMVYNPDLATLQF